MSAERKMILADVLFLSLIITFALKIEHESALFHYLARGDVLRQANAADGADPEPLHNDGQERLDRFCSVALLCVQDSDMEAYFPYAIIRNSIVSAASSMVSKTSSGTKRRLSSSSEFS